MKVLQNPTRVLQNGRKKNRAQKRSTRRAALLLDIAEVLLAVNAKTPPAQLLARIAAGDFTNLAHNATADYYDQLCAGLPPYWRAYYADVQRRNGLLWRADAPTLSAKTLQTMGPVVEKWAREAGLISAPDAPR